MESLITNTSNISSVHDACYVLEEDVSNLKQLLNCSGLDERFELLVDIHINELQLVVHDCDKEQPISILSWTTQATSSNVIT